MRMPAKTFEDLIVWQKAHELTLSVYKLTQKFPLEEVSKTLEAYSRSILNSDSRILNTRGQT